MDNWLGISLFTLLVLPIGAYLIAKLGTAGWLAARRRFEQTEKDRP